MDSETSKPSFEKQAHSYSLLTPFSQKTLKITQDITQELEFLSQLAQAILLFGCVLVLCFVVILISFMQSFHSTIRNLSTQLSKMQPQHIQTFDSNAIPSLLKPLLLELNRALKCIHDYFSKEKQLYAGIAHELKTPLAVIKTKCEVVL